MSVDVDARRDSPVTPLGVAESGIDHVDEPYAGLTSAEHNGPKTDADPEGISPKLEILLAGFEPVPHELEGIFDRHDQELATTNEAQNNYREFGEEQLDQDPKYRSAPPDETRAHLLEVRTNILFLTAEKKGFLDTRGGKTSENIALKVSAEVEQRHAELNNDLRSFAARLYKRMIVIDEHFKRHWEEKPEENPSIYGGTAEEKHGITRKTLASRLGISEEEFNNLYAHEHMDVEELHIVSVREGEHYPAMLARERDTLASRINNIVNELSAIPEWIELAQKASASRTFAIQNKIGDIKKHTRTTVQQTLKLQKLITEERHLEILLNPRAQPAEEQEAIIAAGSELELSLRKERFTNNINTYYQVIKSERATDRQIDINQTRGSERKKKLQTAFAEWAGRIAGLREAEIETEILAIHHLRVTANPNDVDGLNVLAELINRLGSRAKQLEQLRAQGAQAIEATQTTLSGGSEVIGQKYIFNPKTGMVEIYTGPILVPTTEPLPSQQDASRQVVA